MDRPIMGVYDYILLILTLFVSLMIGIYFHYAGGKQKTAKEYLMGDHKQSILPVALSIMASFMSSITLLGVSAEVYMYGTLFLTIIGSYILFTAIAAYLYLPVFFKLRATSAYQYLELRFGSEVRLVASLLYSLQMVLYMGVVLYAPAIALEALTGLSRNISILTIGGVCTIYSTIGGIKAVIWTDVFQSVLMYMALFSVIIVAVWIHGGFTPIWMIAQDHRRIQFFDFTLDPTVRHTTWSLFVGGGFTFLSLYAVNQTQVQRYLTMKDYRTAVKSLWLSLPFLYLLLLACGFAGLSIFSVYADCDLLKSGRVSSPDQLMPVFVMDQVGQMPGLSGLFAAGIFSASLSTVSACVNSLAAVTVEDYFKRMFPKRQFSVGVTKCVALVYGVACVAVAYLAQHLGGLLQAGLSILGIVGGPLLGTFTLGMFVPSANQPGALAGIVSGLLTALWVGFSQPKPKPVPLPLSTTGCLFNATTLTTTMSPTLLEQNDIPYLNRLSYLLYVVISCLVTLAVGCGVSLIVTMRGYCPPHTVDPDLFSPPVAHYLRARYQPANREVLGEMTSPNEEEIKM